jgi:Holliday junction resolvasome RuvABC endonuclease subunit
MRIIAFDLGSHFAWASNLKGHSWGHIDLEGIRPHRLGKLLTFLQAQVWFKQADVALYECPFTRGLAASRSLWGTAGVLEAVVSEMGLPVVDANLREIKKFAAGDGNAPKSAMIVSAKKWGYSGTNDNEADAICILNYGKKFLERSSS